MAPVNRTPVCCSFSLRTLLALVGALGIALGWLGNWCREIGEQRLVIDHLADRGYQLQLESGWAEWLQSRFGLNAVIAVDGIESITRWKCDVTEEDLKAINNLRFSRLTLFECSVSDDTMESLVANPKLNEVEATSCGLGDRTLKHLSRLDDLLVIDFSGNPITDDGIAHLSQLKRLHTLVLNNTPLTDKSVQHLQEMKQLEALLLLDTSITPARATELRRKLPDCGVSHFTTPPTVQPTRSGG